MISSPFAHLTPPASVPGADMFQKQFQRREGRGARGAGADVSEEARAGPQALGVMAEARWYMASGVAWPRGGTGRLLLRVKSTGRAAGMWASLPGKVRAGPTR